MFDDGKVRGVDERYDEGDDGISSVVLGIRKDDKLGLTKGCLCGVNARLSASRRPLGYSEGTYRYHQPHHGPTR